MSTTIGRAIANRIRITGELGQGGMGTVYRGEQLSLKRTVAVKVLRPELCANPRLQRRFVTEAQAIARLQHPNIVQVFDFGQDGDGSLFIAMELVDGRSLRTVLSAEAALHPARALHIAHQVAAALIEAHARGVVHGDIKPDNVMLQQRGRERDVARVLDFGIARLRDDSPATATQTGDVLGTPQYMAPEQIHGGAIDGRCDVYALGCLLYEMLTAHRPFEASSVVAILSKHLTEPAIPPSQRRPELGLPVGVDQVVLAAMAKDPDHRPTMEHYADMLAGALRALSADRASPPRAFAHQPRTSTGSRRLPIALVALALVLVGSGVGVWAATRARSSSTDHRDNRADLRDVVRRPVPAPPPPASTPASAQRGYTCDQVADKVLALATQMITERMTEAAEMEALSKQKLTELTTTYRAQARAVHARVIQECNTTNWPDTKRACVMSATSLAEDRCK